MDEQAIRVAAHAYEQALVDGDTAAAVAWFDQLPTVSRFGPEGAQFGGEQVRALRAAAAPVAAPEWLHDEVRDLGGAALHLALLRRGSATVQRTQVWVRREEGWRIAHAHVSRVDTP